MKIIHEVISNGDTYVAEGDDNVAGTFIMKDDFPDLGSHVANASYMTLKSESGKGIGTARGNSQSVKPGV